MSLASRRGHAWVWLAGLGIAALSPDVTAAARRHVDRLDARPREARQDIATARQRLAAHRANLPSFLHDGARAARIRARGALTRPESRAARAAKTAASARAGVQPDTVSLLVVRVGFAANRRPDLTSMDASGDFRLAPDTTVVVDPPPHDVAYFDAQILALRDYYRLQSHDRVEVLGSVFPPAGEPSLKLSDMADYGPGDGGRWTLELLEAWFRAAGAVLDSAAVGRVDLPTYDCIAFCHPGSDLQNDIDANSPNDLPTFFVTLADSIPVVGGEIRSGVVFPETTTQDGLLGGILGGFCHEFGHSLGLPDLYDTYNGLPAIGEWDLMDSGNAAFFAFQVADSEEVLFALGLLPTGLSALSRVLLGWEDPYTVRAPDDVVTLRPANTVQGTGPRVARLDVSADEYFLIENRRDLLADHPGDVEACPYLNRDAATGVVLWMSRDDAMRPSRERRNSGEYDFFIAAPTAPEAELGACGQTGFGLLAWHVDERVIADGYAFNEVNADERNRGLRLVEASGDFEIGDWRMPTVSFVGDGWNDPFRAGYRTALGANTVPNNWNSDWAHSGWEIRDVEFVAPESHALSVHVVDGVAGWPLLVRAAFDTLPPIEPKGALVASIPGAGTVLVVADSSGAWIYDATGGRRVRAARRVHPASLAFHPRLAAGDAAGTLAFLDSTQVWLCDAQLVGDSLAVRSGFPIAIPGGCGERLALVADDGGAPPGAVIELPNRSWALVDAGGVARSIDVDAGRESDPIVGPVAVGGAPGVALVGRDEVGFWALRSDGPPPRAVQHGLADTTLLAAAGRWRANDGGAAPVVVLHPDGRLRVLDADGGIRPGFQDLPADRYLGLALADLTGDGELDIVAASATRIAGVTSRGARLLNSPRVLRDVYGVQRSLQIVAGPIVADVAGDSLPEILVTTDLGLVYALDADLGVVDGYPRKMLPDLFPAEVCAADVDGDGAPEIVGVASIAANAAAPPGGSARFGWSARGGNFARTGFASTPAALGSGASTRLTAGERPLLAYPNPAPGDVVQLRMTAVQDGEFALAIYTLEGERVFERRGTLAIGTQEIAWRVGDLAPGVYLCRFVSPAAGVPTPMVEAITLLR